MFSVKDAASSNYIETSHCDHDGGAVVADIDPAHSDSKCFQWSREYLQSEGMFLQTRECHMQLYTRVKLPGVLHVY